METLIAFIQAHDAVCQKEHIEKSECETRGQKIIDDVKVKIIDLCKENFPWKEGCHEIAFTYALAGETQKLIYRLTLKDA